MATQQADTRVINGVVYRVERDNSQLSIKKLTELPVNVPHSWLLTDLKPTGYGSHVVDVPVTVNSQRNFSQGAQVKYSVVTRLGVLFVLSPKGYKHVSRTIGLGISCNIPCDIGQVVIKLIKMFNLLKRGHQFLSATNEFKQPSITLGAWFYRRHPQTQPD